MTGAYSWDPVRCVCGSDSHLFVAAARACHDKPRHCSASLRNGFLRGVGCVPKKLDDIIACTRAENHGYGDVSRHEQCKAYVYNVILDSGCRFQEHYWRCVA